MEEKNKPTKPMILLFLLLGISKFLFMVAMNEVEEQPTEDYEITFTFTSDKLQDLLLKD